MLWVTDILTKEVAGYPAGTPVCCSFIGIAMPYAPSDPLGWGMSFRAQEEDLMKAPRDSQWITFVAACLDGSSPEEIQQLVTSGELELHPTDAVLCRPTPILGPLNPQLIEELQEQYGITLEKGNAPI